MTKILAKQIIEFWNSNCSNDQVSNSQVFISSQTFNSNVIKLTFCSYPAQREQRYDLTLELSKDAYQAQQEVYYGSFIEMDNFLKSSELIELLEKRLKTLNEAIKEMMG